MVVTPMVLPWIPLALVRRIGSLEMGPSMMGLTPAEKALSHFSFLEAAHQASGILPLPPQVKSTSASTPSARASSSV